MFDEKTRLFLGPILALDGTNEHNHLTSLGYTWRRFADVDKGVGEWPRFRNYVQEAVYHELKARESRAAAQAYQDAR